MFYFIRDGQRLRNGFNVSWKRGPQVIVFLDLPWWQFALRVRWRTNYKPHLITQMRFLRAAERQRLEDQIKAYR